MQKLQEDSQNEDSQSEKQEEKIEEEYKNWKHNVPFLYDIAITHKLLWPSLTVQWLPDFETDVNDNEVHKLLVGTNTSGAEQNYLKILSVTLPKVIDEDMDPTLTINIRKTQNIGKVVEVANIPHLSEVNRARYMPQLPTVIAAWTDIGEIHIYDTHQSQNGPVLKLHSHQSEGYGLSWSQLKRGFLLSAGYDRKVALWDFESQSKTPITEFKMHQKEAEDVSWHSNQENLFASCSDDTTLALVDIRSGVVLQEKVHESEVNSVQFNPFEENKLATGSSDNSIKLFDIRRLDRELHQLEQHDEPVYALQWSPHNPRYLASGSADRRIIIWDTVKLGGEIKAEDERDGPAEMMFVHGGHLSKVNDLSWNLNIPFIIASVDESTNVVQIWRMQRTVLDDDEDDMLIIEEIETSNSR